MGRRMSCSLTTAQVYDRTKTETRRHPDTWPDVKPGDIVTLIEKGMGLPKGARQVVITDVVILSNEVEPIRDLTPEELAAEGFPDWTPAEFTAMWRRSHKPADEWRVLKWRYPPYDLVGEYRGPCGLCGYPDQRHRVFEAIEDMVNAGDDAASVAADYGLTVEAVEQIAAWASPPSPTLGGRDR